MILPDVSVLVYAHRVDVPEHDAYGAWLRALATADAPFAAAGDVLASFLRIVTNPRIFREPTPLPTALAFCDQLLRRPGCVRVRPGPRHWGLFVDLCQASGARGKPVPDAALAALAIEHGCELATADADFARFPGLVWRHPLRAA